jgi:cell wall-associated NlpC family hydrolase
VRRAMGGVMQIAVAVATLWASPAAARQLTPVQELTLSTRERVALVGRIETQALRGESVRVLARRGRWVKVAVLDQPSPRNRYGYPGWMLASQLLRRVAPLRMDSSPAPVATAKRFLGVRYLWGGTSPYGFDCSGLTWYAFRAAGVTIPRDADAQFAAGRPVSLEDARRGDLLFYGVPTVTHVALYLGRGRMIESPDSAHAVRIVPIRTRNFAGARRFAH